MPRRPRRTRQHPTPPGATRASRADGDLSDQILDAAQTLERYAADLRRRASWLRCPQSPERIDHRRWALVDVEAAARLARAALEPSTDHNAATTTPDPQQADSPAGGPGGSPREGH